MLSRRLEPVPPHRALLTAVEAGAMLTVTAVLTESEPYPGIIGGLGVCFWALTYMFRSGLLPVMMLRLLAIGVPGISAGLIKLYDPNLYIAYYFMDFQTIPVTKKVVLTTAFALGGAILAWAAIWLKPAAAKDAKTPRQAPPLGGLYALFAIFGVVLAFLDLGGRGAAIWREAYGFGETSPAFLGLRIYGVATIGCMISLVALALFHPEATQRTRLFTAFFTLSVFALSYLPLGARSEVIAFLFGSLSLVVLKRRRSPRLLSLVILFASLAFFSFVMAQFRAFLVTGKSLTETVAETVDPFALDFIEIGHGGNRPRISSLSPIENVNLLYGTIGLVDINVFSMRYGGTLLDHVRNTLPGSINPFRTEEIALLFRLHDWASAGGFMEIAEGYLNFGYSGAALFGFALSGLYFSAYRAALMGSSLYTIIWYGYLTSFIVRVAFYGVNDIYKGVITWLVITMTIRMLLVLWSKARPASLPIGLDGPRTA
ncbi:MAG: hypothetical protein U1E97_11780 [Alphaproteobacteria bacterium]